MGDDQKTRAGNAIAKEEGIRLLLGTKKFPDKWEEAADRMPRSSVPFSTESSVLEGRRHAGPIGIKEVRGNGGGQSELKYEGGTKWSLYRS